MKPFYIFTFVYLLSFSLCAQTVHTVDSRPNSGAQFTSVQAAHDAASTGDIIQIHPSETGYGTVIVSKQITLIGMGHNPANSNDGTNAVLTITLTGEATNSVFTGLEISAVNNTNGGVINLNGIQFINNLFEGSVSINSSIDSDNNWLFKGNVFFTAGLFANQSNNWVVENNLFISATTQFANFNNTCSIINNTIISSSNNMFNNTNAIVDNNIFTLNGNNTSLGISANSSISFNNCLTFSLQGNTITPLNGNNNLDNTDPLFVNVPINTSTDFYNNNYNLQVSSPGVNAGTDGTDIGLSGLNFTFDANGRPNDYPYMTSLNITNSTIEPGQPLQVEFTAEKKQ